MAFLKNTLNLDGGAAARQGIPASVHNATADSSLEAVHEAAERSLAETPEAKGAPEALGPSVASLGSVLQAQAQQEASS